MDHSEFMVLARQLDEVYRKSILGFAGERLARVPNSRVHVLFGVAGFRPGRRGPFDLAQDRPFVSAKGPKTTDAPSGLMGGEGRRPEKGGPTRGACPESYRRAHTRPASG